MSDIQLFNKTFGPYLPESLIQEKISELGKLISKEYEGKKIKSNPELIPYLSTENE